MKRKEQLDELVKLFAIFKAQVELSNRQGEYDINTHSEDLLASLFSCIYDGEFVNVNFQKKNNPAVDLIDSKARVCVQVTSTATFKKIRETLEKYFNAGYHNQCNTLLFYFLIKKPKLNRKSKKNIKDFINGKINFDVDNHLLDDNSILTILRQDASGEKVNCVLNLLEKEYGELNRNKDLTLNKRLGQLPFNADLFIGREADLEAIYQRLFNSGDILLLVNGEGGIGKTTLAAQYYFNYQDQYTHVAWVFAGSGLMNGLLTLAKPLKVFDETLANEELLDALLEQMRQLPKPCLLVIDNANQIGELEQYYSKLGSCPNFHVLITTRIAEFERAALHKVLPLGDQEAIKLFKEYYPEHLSSEDSLLEQLLLAIGKNTLVIELLAKNLRKLNQFRVKYNLSNLLQDLQNKGLLGIHSQEVRTAYLAENNQLRKEKPESIIEAMYELGGLSSQEQPLLTILSTLPAENIHINILESLLLEVEDFDSTLGSLVEQGWIEWNKSHGSFKMNPVVQEVTRKKSSDLLATCRPLIVGLIMKLRYEPSTGQLTHASYEDAAVYARYAEYLLSNLDDIEIGTDSLYEMTANYYKVIGYSQKALELSVRMKFQSEKLYLERSKDPNYRYIFIVSHVQIGDIYYRLRQQDKALENYKQYNRLSEKLYRDYSQNNLFKRNFAVSCSKLGEILRHSNSKEAFEYINRENKLFQELADIYPFNLAVSHEKLGSYYLDINEPNKAFESFRKATELFQKLLAEQPEAIEVCQGLATSHQRIGRSLLRMKSPNLDKALKHLTVAERIFEHLSRSYPQNVGFKQELAVLYEQLCKFYRQLTNPNLNKALEYSQKANAIFKGIYEAYPDDPNHTHSLAVSYMITAEIFETRNEYRDSIATYEQVKQLLSNLKQQFPENNDYSENLKWVTNRIAILSNL